MDTPLAGVLIRYIIEVDLTPKYANLIQ